MSLLDNDAIGKAQLLEYMDINRTASDIQEVRTALYNTFATLIQYPSILSKHKNLRNIVQIRLSEFLNTPDISSNLIDILLEVQYLISILKTRSDYVD